MIGLFVEVDDFVEFYGERWFIYVVCDCVGLCKCSVWYVSEVV